MTTGQHLPPTPANPASIGTIRFTTELAPEYGERRNRLAQTFPAAHRFLSDLELLCTMEPRFHLGTAKNLHLYLGDRVLCYIRMEKPASLVVSPVPNANHIKVGTRPDPGALMPRPMNEVVMRHKGYSAGWARRPGDIFTFTEATPAAFFTDLFELIRATKD